jgi:hypothetical protein
MDKERAIKTGYLLANAIEKHIQVTMMYNMDNATTGELTHSKEKLATILTEILTEIPNKPSKNDKPSSITLD